MSRLRTLQSKGLSAADQFFGESPVLSPDQVRARLTGLLLGLVLVLFFAGRITGDLKPGTDAESVLLGVRLGIGPQPGAPLLYLALGAATAVFGFLPPAAAIHFFAVLCTVTGAVFLFAMLHQACGRRLLPALGGAVLVALHPMVRDRAVAGGPESIVWMLLAIQMWMLWSFASRRTPSWRAFLAVCLIQGCLIGISPATIVMLPALLLVFAARGSWLFRHPSTWLGGVGMLIVGMLPWIYFFVRTSTEVYLRTSAAPRGLEDFTAYIATAPLWGELGRQAMLAPAFLVEDLAAKTARVAAGVSPLMWLAMALGAGRMLLMRGRWGSRLWLAAAVGGVASVAWLATLPLAATLIAVAGIAGVFLAPVRRPALAMLPLLVAWPICLATPESAQVLLLPGLFAAGLLTAQGFDVALRRLPRVGVGLLAGTLIAQVAMPLLAPPGAEGVPASSARRSPAGDAATGDRLNELEIRLWPYSGRPILLVCEADLQPLFWAQQAIRGQFFGYWFVENARDWRAVWHPDLGDIVHYRDASSVVQSVWHDREVLVVSRQTDIPRTPEGMHFVVKDKLRLLGESYYIWRLEPISDDK